MTYKIDNDVPVPPLRGAGGRPPVYPLADLEIGQSFFAAGKTASNMSSAWNSPGVKALGRKFKSRTTSEGGVDGTRVWRVA